MRVKTTQRLRVEDFPDQKDWIGKLVSPLNDFLTQAIKILNDGLQFTDNFIGKEHVFDFEYQSDVLSFPTGFLWTIAANPKALSVVAATEDDDPVNVAVSWQFTDLRQVELVHVVRFTTAPAVAALAVGSRYKIRVRVTP